MALIVSARVRIRVRGDYAHGSVVLRMQLASPSMTIDA